MTAEVAAPPRHQRTVPAGRPGVPIAVKLGGLLTLLVVVLLAVAGVMFGQLRDVQERYDALLSAEVQQGLQARKMQVEFKEQVRAFENVLLRGANPADLAAYTRQFRDRAGIVAQLDAELLREVRDPATLADLQRFGREQQALTAGYERVLAPFVAAGARGSSAAADAVRGQDRAPNDRVDGIVGRIEKSVADAVAAQKAELAARQSLLLAVGTLLLTAVLAVVALVVLGIVRPIHRLTRDAYRAAHETLPEAVARIRSLPVDAEPPVLPPVHVRTRDELEELGRALSTMQTSAVELAVQQHRAERESAQMLINLGRRNQNLLGRTLSYITELERTERDPAVLAQLFRLDHATTRMRRGAESMLVLAGATQTRTWSRPVPVADVARAALSEIEDYQRVDLYHLEDASVVGSTVADLVHLVAELVENGTHFSPPEARVTVLGQHAADGGYRLRIVDQGIGMTGRELDDANARIHRAATGGADTRLLGLHVVGLLAARRGLEVVLEPSAGRGITANVVVPAGLVAAVADATGPGAAGEEEAEPAVRVPAVAAVPALRSREPAPAIASGAAERVAPVSTIPRPRSVPAADTRGPAPADAAALPEPGTAVPRRVRGAQLPDAGSAADRAFAAPDTGAIRGRLQALQAGARAARTGAEPEPTPDGGAQDGRPGS